MSYTKLPARQSGLSGAESCGPNQQWDPNYKFNGIVGQCTPKGSPMTPAPSPGLWDTLIKIGGTLFGSKTPTTMTPGPYPYPTQSETPSWVIPVVVGGGVLAAVLLLRKKR